jgi:hypothetical protein
MAEEIERELFYTTNEVEALFDLDVVTIMDLIIENKVTAKKVNDEWLISESSIKQYINEYRRT